MSFPVEAIRSEFPGLSLSDAGKPRIYFDNPAGTQVPQRVIDRIRDCLVASNANLHGHFASSQSATAIVAEAHQAMADLLNANSAKEIVFGQNMTSLTFQFSRSIGKLLNPGDEIILTRMEHDANVTPWVLLARDIGLEIKWWDFDHDAYEFDILTLDPLLSERTRLVCVCQASNLLGTINDVTAITECAHSVGALVYVDSVQYAPHAPIDVQALGCDFLVCSAYKFYGPHQGILWGREAVLEHLPPYKLRPAPDSLPGRFETGTLNHEAMAGVTAAVDYLAWIGERFACSPDSRFAAFEGRRRHVRDGLDLAFAYESILAKRVIEGLLDIQGVRIHGITDPAVLARRVPTVSFTLAGLDPARIAKLLGRANIFVWHGHYYAVEPINALGLHDSGGVVRIGIVHYNTMQEIDACLDVLRNIQRGNDPMV